MDEATIREIVRDEIAKALRAAEVDGPHMERFRKADERRVRIEIAQDATRAAIAEIETRIRQGARPADQRFRL